MTIGWITEAPIYQAANKKQAKVLLRRLLKNMEGWETPPEVPARTSSAEWATGQWAVWPGERTKWGDRAGSSQGLVDDMLEEIGDNEEAWFYMLDGQPIAAMTLDLEEGFIHIDYLVSHPGSADGGGALIQKAVQRSAAEGNGGKVRLCAANDNAHSMYLHMGFADIEDADPDDMELNPATSDKWASSGGSYRYKSYLVGSVWGA